MSMLWGKMNVDWQARVDFDRLRKERVAKANQMLHKHGIGSAIIYNWDSRRYVSSVWNHPYSRHIPFDYALLIRDGGFPYVHVMKGLDDQRVREDCPWLEGRLLEDAHIGEAMVNRMTPEPAASELWKRNAQLIKSLLKEHGVADLPCSLDYAGPHLMKALQDQGINVVDGNAWMQEARMIKTDDEVALLRLAATCNEAGYSALAAELRPGMRENDAQAIMAKAIYAAGAEYIEGWVVCSGPRTAPRSFNWSDRVIRPGEILTLEACHVTYCGYKVCYDRSFVVGAKPTDLQKEIYGVAVDMHHKVGETLRPGITSHDAARLRPIPSPTFRTLEDVRNYRTGWRNHFGGMGISWYEAPYLLLEEPAVELQKNMIIAYHAVYHVEGVVGVALENTYRITDTGCESLCQLPWEELPVLGV